ncbi:MAG TPA: DUF2303 family protein [Azospirillaceae bacterium]|nr:DUF2303 family protein [Azospirillaceae bacterium]
MTQVNDLKDVLGLVLDQAKVELLPTSVSVPYTDQSIGLHLAAVPTGKEVVDLTALADKYLPRPRALAEKARLYTSASLVDYVNRFRTAETALFVTVDPAAPGITAYLDYHAGTASGTRVDGEEDRAALPSHLRHTAAYLFPLSDELKAWRAFEAKGFTPMNEFAWFLEERLNDITNAPVDWGYVPYLLVDGVCELLNLRDDFVPGTDRMHTDEELEEHRRDQELPAGYRTRRQKLAEIKFGSQQQILTLSQEMTVRVDSRTAQKIDLHGGARTLVFEDSQETEVKGAKVKVPEMFLLDIPLFDGEPSVLIPARLYYRKTGAGIVWAVKLVNNRQHIRRAVEQVAARVAKETGCPLYSGRPNGGDPTPART